MKTKWQHLHFWFKDGAYEKIAKSANYKGKPYGEYKRLILYIQKIVLRYSTLKRFFFLFEEKPHLFLALEMPEGFDCLLPSIKKPDFIKDVMVIENGGDEDNGDWALDMFHASAKFAFYRCSEKYEPKYLSCDENKLIHCFCNSNMVSWENEINFYLVGLIQRGVNVGGLLDFVKGMKPQKYLEPPKALKKSKSVKRYLGSVENMINKIAKKEKWAEKTMEAVALGVPLIVFKNGKCEVKGGIYAQKETEGNWRI